jgi:hypothetical protein
MGIIFLILNILSVLAIVGFVFCLGKGDAARGSLYTQMLSFLMRMLYIRRSLIYKHDNFFIVLQGTFVIQSLESYKSSHQSAISSCVSGNPTNTIDYCERLNPLAPEISQVLVAFLLGYILTPITLLSSDMKQHPDRYPPYALFTGAPGTLQPSQSSQQQAEPSAEVIPLEVVSDEPTPDEPPHDAPPARLQS